jgi:hypothetical protein
MTKPSGGESIFHLVLDTIEEVAKDARDTFSEDTPIVKPMLMSDIYDAIDREKERERELEQEIGGRSIMD